MIRGFAGTSEIKKRPSSQLWDKSRCFCDTTQIDVFESVRSLTRTIIRAPMDNGWDPVGVYSEQIRSKPPSEVHSPVVRHPDSTLRDSLKARCAGYYSSSQV